MPSLLFFADMGCSPFYLVAYVSLAVAGLVGSARADSPIWKTYSNAHHRFIVQYPDTTEAEIITEKEAGLVSRVAFRFEQPFITGGDAGSLKFSFQISVWQNTNHLTAEAWARLKIKPELTLETLPVQIAGRNGVLVRTTNLAWPLKKIFVVESDCLYELSFMDIGANKPLLSQEIRGHWTAVLDRIVESFQILPQEHRPK